MADVNGINGSNPLGALQSAGRTIRITPAAPNPPQTARPADTINFSQAARELEQTGPVTPPTYGTSGLQATTPTAAREALGAATRQMVAARVDQPMDYRSGEVTGTTGMPFYTNPATANGVATSTSVARLGGSIDTNA